MNIANPSGELFSVLKHCGEFEWKEKVEEMNRMLEGMNPDEFTSILTEDLFNIMYKMIKEKELTLENIVTSLKHIGYYKVLKQAFIISFEDSFLCERFESMIIDENEKNEEKNEKLLVDLCECYLMLHDSEISKELLSISVFCLLNFASNKEENEETQKEVEMAFVALTRVERFTCVKKELYKNRIKEVIQYHQEHHNLTRLAYQSVWEFLINRLNSNKSLNKVFVNELHFIREAIKELEELAKNIHWKREKEEEKGNETKEEIVLLRWIQALDLYFYVYRLWKVEYVELISCLVNLCRAARESKSEIVDWCFYLLKTIAEIETVSVDAFSKGGAVDLILEGMQQPTFEDKITSHRLKFFLALSGKLKRKKDNESGDVKRKLSKMEIFERIEEEGYEDIITSFHETLYFLSIIYDYELSVSISDYFVSI